MACILCHSTLSSSKSWDYNLIDGKRQFNVRDALQKFEVAILPTSKYICKACLRHLVKIDNARNRVKELENEVLEKYFRGAKQRGIQEEDRSSRRSLFPEENVEEARAAESCRPRPTPSPCTDVNPVPVLPLLSPIREEQRCLTDPGSVTVLASTPLFEERKGAKRMKGDINPGTEETSVTVRVEWNCKTREKKLPSDLISVGTMLCRGTYKQLANSVWKHNDIRSHLIEIFLKEIDKECCNLCVAPKPEKPLESRRSCKILVNSPGKKKINSRVLGTSCLRLTKKEEVMEFSFEKLDCELQDRAPLMRSALMAMSRRKSKRRDDDLFFMPVVGMAAAVCLKNRSRHMTVVQLLLSLMMQHSGFMVRQSSQLQSRINDLYIYYLIICIDFVSYVLTGYINQIELCKASSLPHIPIQEDG